MMVFAWIRLPSRATPTPATPTIHCSRMEPWTISSSRCRRRPFKTSRWSAMWPARSSLTARSNWLYTLQRTGDLQVLVVCVRRRPRQWGQPHPAGHQPSRRPGLLPRVRRPPVKTFKQPASTRSWAQLDTARVCLPLLCEAEERGGERRRFFATRNLPHSALRTPTPHLP